MREIKFRFWDKENKKMGIGHNLLHIGNQFIDCHNNPDTFEIMQFTGIFDKNNKEIYEGDIINAKWKSGQDIGIEKCPNIIPYFHFYEEMDDIDCEVIGNIYENPELLTN